MDTNVHGTVRKEMIVKMVGATSSASFLAYTGFQDDIFCLKTQRRRLQKVQIDTDLTQSST